MSESNDAEEEKLKLLAKIKNLEDQLLEQQEKYNKVKVDNKQGKQDMAALKELIDQERQEAEKTETSLESLKKQNKDL